MPWLPPANFVEARYLTYTLFTTQRAQVAAPSLCADQSTEIVFNLSSIQRSGTTLSRRHSELQCIFVAAIGGHINSNCGCIRMRPAAGQRVCARCVHTPFVFFLFLFWGMPSRPPKSSPHHPILPQPFMKKSQDSGRCVWNPQSAARVGDDSPVTDKDTRTHTGQTALETAIPRLPKPARQASVTTSTPQSTFENLLLFSPLLPGS